MSLSRLGNARLQDQVHVTIKCYFLDQKIENLKKVLEKSQSHLNAFMIVQAVFSNENS